jgi:glycyl-tRNA synthetase beta chain
MPDHKVLLEIGVEELPSSEVSAIRKQLKEGIEKSLEMNRINHGGLEVFIASRRFGIYIDSLASKQADYFEEKKGPSEKIAFKDGTPTKALLGFLKSNGAELSQTSVRDGYVYVEREISGKPSLEILPGAFSESILSIDFKKPMRWGDGTRRFVRPVRWIVAMIDDEIIDFELFGIRSTNLSKGHRFYFDELKVRPGDYFDILRSSMVIAKEEERRTRVLSEIRRVETLLNGSIPIDQDLLEEVVSLTEYPTAVVGQFKEKYLTLPPEVIIVTIKHHQRTFPVQVNDRLTSNFVAFQDGPDDPAGNIKLGYEDVINARLEDAFFYFEKDLERTLDSYVDGLKEILFQRGLGSLFDKTQRTAAIASKIGKLLKAREGELRAIERTALLAKADQVTRVVQEFPEVQGVMGRIYAFRAGESDEVAVGIEEHYLDQRVPTSLTGAVVGVADRLDTLAGNFVIGNIPTSSKDPYALRRKMSFIYNTMVYLGWKLDLEELIRLSAITLSDNNDNAVTALITFCKTRYEAYLIDQGYSINIARALNNWWKIPYLGERAARSIADFIKRDEFKDLLVAYQRVHNISKKHQDTQFEGAKFVEQAERDLFNAYLKCFQEVSDALEADDFDRAFQLLTDLKPMIDRYFDDVFVMADQEDIRLNRLGFLKSFDSLFLKIGDLSLLLEEERK